MPTLNETQSVQLDNSGNGICWVGPLSAREKWQLANVHVRVATANNEATCAIYVGDAPDDRNFRDQTFTGSSGDATDRVSADVVGVGAKVWAVWEGGDPKAQASMNITGSKVLS